MYLNSPDVRNTIHELSWIDGRLFGARRADDQSTPASFAKQHGADSREALLARFVELVAKLQELMKVALKQGVEPEPPRTSWGAPSF